MVTACAPSIYAPSVLPRTLNRLPCGLPSAFCFAKPVAVARLLRALTRNVPRGTFSTNRARLITPRVPLYRPRDSPQVDADAHVRFAKFRDFTPTFRKIAVTFRNFSQTSRRATASSAVSFPRPCAVLRPTSVPRATCRFNLRLPPNSLSRPRDFILMPFPLHAHADLLRIIRCLPFAHICLYRLFHVEHPRSGGIIAQSDSLYRLR